MRPFKPADAIRAIEVTSRMPTVHVAPDAKLPLVITHVPGHMLVTDLGNADLTQ